MFEIITELVSRYRTVELGTWVLGCLLGYLVFGVGRLLSIQRD